MADRTQRNGQQQGLESVYQSGITNDPRTASSTEPKPVAGHHDDDSKHHQSLAHRAKEKLHHVKEKLTADDDESRHHGGRAVFSGYGIGTAPGGLGDGYNIGATTGGTPGTFGGLTAAEYGEGSRPVTGDQPGLNAN